MTEKDMNVEIDKIKGTIDEEIERDMIFFSSRSMAKSCMAGVTKMPPPSSITLRRK